MPQLPPDNSTIPLTTRDTSLRLLLTELFSVSLPSGSILAQIVSHYASTAPTTTCRVSEFKQFVGPKSGSPATNNHPIERIYPPSQIKRRRIPPPVRIPEQDQKTWFLGVGTWANENRTPKRIEHVYKYNRATLCKHDGCPFFHDATETCEQAADRVELQIISNKWAEIDPDHHSHPHRQPETPSDDVCIHGLLNKRSCINCEELTSSQQRSPRPSQFIVDAPWIGNYVWPGKQEAPRLVHDSPIKMRQFYGLNAAPGLWAPKKTASMAQFLKRPTSEPDSTRWHGPRERWADYARRTELLPSMWPHGRNGQEDININEISVSSTWADEVWVTGSDEYLPTHEVPPYRPIIDLDRYYKTAQALLSARLAERRERKDRERKRFWRVADFNRLCRIDGSSAAYRMRHRVIFDRSFELPVVNRRKVMQQLDSIVRCEIPLRQAGPRSQADLERMLVWGATNRYGAFVSMSLDDKIIYGCGGGRRVNTAGMPVDAEYDVFDTDPHKEKTIKRDGFAEGERGDNNSGDYRSHSAFQYARSWRWSALTYRICKHPRCRKLFIGYENKEHCSDNCRKRHSELRMRWVIYNLLHRPASRLWLAIREMMHK